MCGRPTTTRRPCTRSSHGRRLIYKPVDASKASGDPQQPQSKISCKWSEMYQAHFIFNFYILYAYIYWRSRKLLLKVSFLRPAVYFILFMKKEKMILPVFGFVQCIHVMLCYIYFVVLPEVPGPRPGGGVVSRLAWNSDAAANATFPSLEPINS